MLELRTDQFVALAYWRANGATSFLRKQLSRLHAVTRSRAREHRPVNTLQLVKCLCQSRNMPLTSVPHAYITFTRFYSRAILASVQGRHSQVVMSPTGSSISFPHETVLNEVIRLSLTARKFCFHNFLPCLKRAVTQVWLPDDDDAAAAVRICRYHSTGRLNDFPY